MVHRVQTEADVERKRRKEDKRKERAKAMEGEGEVEGDGWKEVPSKGGVTAAAVSSSTNLLSHQQHNFLNCMEMTKSCLQIDHFSEK